MVLVFQSVSSLFWSLSSYCTDVGREVMPLNAILYLRNSKQANTSVQCHIRLQTSMSCLQQFIQYDTSIFIVYFCSQQMKYFSVCCLDLSRNTQNNIQCNRITHTYPQAHDILQNITTDEHLQDEDETHLMYKWEK